MVMFKFANAFKLTEVVIAAAAIAAVVTVLTGASDPLGAGPLAEPEQSVLQSCTQRPWPYLNCVGTSLGDQRIRLVTTERLQ